MFVFKPLTLCFKDILFFLLLHIQSACQIVLKTDNFDEQIFKYLYVRY